ncbi:hypothetical protein ACFVUN_20980 [Kitasatospora griseola]|uniref:hypothetical protein n=1 Tax=Kitasatospora griseola TaxID=2064 RepID=UPI0036DA482C
MYDVTSTVGRAGGRSHWSGEKAVSAAREAALVLAAKVDWDDDAGEDWVSLLVRGVQVLMISAKVPLAVSLEGSCWEPVGIEVVSVPSFEAPLLRCEFAVLSEVLGDGRAALALDADRFSANDLWFATI